MPRWGAALLALTLAGAAACTAASTGDRAASVGGTAPPVAGGGTTVGGVPTKAAPVGPPASRQQARYLERCAGSVCQLVPREEAFANSADEAFDLSSWSPDRRRRASLVSTTPPSDPGPAPQQRALRVFDERAGRSVDLLQVNRQHDEAAPVWSPDGTMIAFESPGLPGDGTATVEVVVADGSGQRTVSPPDAVHACCASWSADGREIAMSVELEGAAASSIVLASATLRAWRHLDTPGLNAFMPTWLADGRVSIPGGGERSTASRPVRSQR